MRVVAPQTPKTGYCSWNYCYMVLIMQPAIQQHLYWSSETENFFSPQLNWKQSQEDNIQKLAWLHS